MSWRTVVVSNRAKLDLKLNHLVVRGDETTKIFISEIYMLIIENTAVSLTACLLSELIKRKVKVIFCDEKRNPASELVAYYGSHDTSLKVKEQIAWAQETKDKIWTRIVSDKIEKQRDLLLENSLSQYELLNDYIMQIEHKDKTNREGHAAKVFFNALFGMDFTRNTENSINAALNYGYSILLSAFSREIVANGYITQLGLFHDNMFNQFNLASDLMEPFRPLIDREVFSMNPISFEHSEKMRIVSILKSNVIIDGKSNYLSNAIGIYCKSIFEALGNDDLSCLRFYRYEL